ncbi:MAG: DUF2281 domain-containing protein [Treponema sp.]|nr:DUF2281 domain-containing protein [Spirochaetia bacterium]MEE1181290.1 DUF2281 domain-containing protein [Treponema sp.]
MNYAIFYVAEVFMPYDVLEKQIKSLPPSYYNELVDYLEFLVSKAKKNAPLTEEESLKKMRNAGVSTAWKYLKNDTW